MGGEHGVFKGAFAQKSGEVAVGVFNIKIVTHTIGGEDFLDIILPFAPWVKE